MNTVSAEVLLDLPACVSGCACELTSEFELGGAR